MDTEELRRYRAWSDNASPNPIALIGLIGCITYETEIDEELHQTAIIRDIYFTQYMAEFGGAVQLTGTYIENFVSVRKSVVGTGPID